MSTRLLRVVTLWVALMAALVTLSPWYAAGLTVAPEPITVQVIANPPP